MNPSRTLAESLEAARRVKSRLTLDGRTDIRPIHEHHRRGRVVAHVHCAGPQEVAGWGFPGRSMRAAAVGFGSDEVRVIFEVVTRQTAKVPSPLPVRGSVLRDFRENPASDAHEALSALRVWRDDAGTIQLEGILAPYEYAEQEPGAPPRLRWLDAERLQGGEVQGAAAGAMSEALGARAQISQLIGTSLDDSIDQADQELFDRVTAKRIRLLYRHVVLLAP